MPASVSIKSLQESISRPSGVKRTINSLQGGRGIAALAVVLLHASLAARDFGAPFPGQLVLSYGYLGVDYFFVLSGFIIYHSTVGRKRSLQDYVAARIRRVYLPYLPIGLGMAALYSALPEVSSSGRHWGWIPTLTLLPVDSSPALSIAWTLQHEVLFYTLFGLFYYTGTLPIGLLLWAASILLLHHHQLFAPINLEFFFGMAAAICYRLQRANALLFLLIPLSFEVWASAAHPDLQRLWVGASIACIVAPIAQLERHTRLKGQGELIPAALIKLGALSYSLYLVHEPIISIVARLAEGSLPILLISVLLSIAGGFAYHSAVERRVIQRKSKPEVFASSENEVEPPLSQKEASIRNVGRSERSKGQEDKLN